MSQDPRTEAAAFHGLATNPAFSPGDRLGCALRALNLYEHLLAAIDAMPEPETDESEPAAEDPMSPGSLALVAAATGGGIRSREVVSQFDDDGPAEPRPPSMLRAVEFDTSDEPAVPRVWAMPEEPEGKVTVRDGSGLTWEALTTGWIGEDGALVTWHWLITNRPGPLTEVMGAAESSTSAMPRSRLLAQWDALWAGTWTAAELEQAKTAGRDQAAALKELAE